MLNKIFIQGRLTADPELKTTNSGVDVCSFTVACDRDFSKKGEDKITDFISVTAWAGTAKFVSSYFGKGRLILIEGQLQSRKWVDKDGNNRTSWEVRAENCYFSDSKRDGGNSTYSAPAASDSPSGDTLSAFSELTGDGEGLPF